MKNFYQYILLLFLSTLATKNMFAQYQYPETRHTILGGAGMTKIKDHILAPRAEQLSATSIGYRFSNSTGRRIKSIEASFETTIDKQGKQNLQAKQFSLSYSQAFLWSRPSAAWRHYTGYKFSISPTYTSLEENYSWATFGTADLYHTTHYFFGRNRISVDVSVPLIGFSSRPALNEEYNNSTTGRLYNSFSHLQLSSPSNLRAFSLNLQYQHELSNRFSVNASGNYTYKELASGPEFVDRSFRLQVGLGFVL